MPNFCSILAQFKLELQQKNCKQLLAQTRRISISEDSHLAALSELEFRATIKRRENCESRSKVGRICKSGDTKRHEAALFLFLCLFLRLFLCLCLFVRRFCFVLFARQKICAKQQRREEKFAFGELGFAAFLQAANCKLQTHNLLQQQTKQSKSEQKTQTFRFCASKVERFLLFALLSCLLRLLRLRSLLRRLRVNCCCFWPSFEKSAEREEFRRSLPSSRESQPATMQHCSQLHHKIAILLMKFAAKKRFFVLFACASRGYSSHWRNKSCAQTRFCFD